MGDEIMAKASVTFVKVPVERYLDLIDAARALSSYANARRQPNCERIGVDGCICPHCGGDPGSDPKSCKLSREDAIKRLRSGEDV